MNHKRSFATALSVLLAGVTVAQGKPEPIAPELAKAQARAKVHNKRVLAVLSAEGEDFGKELRAVKGLGRKLLYEFEMVKYAGKQADLAAAQWHFPDAIQNKPALVVLDADGKVRERINKSDLVADGKLANFLDRLTPHFCEPVDADKKLAAALVDAKKTGRNVFIRFDAPW